MIFCKTITMKAVLGLAFVIGIGRRLIYTG